MTHKTFFALMTALQLLDAVTTAKGLRGGASEANGFLSRLMKSIGVNEALFLIKGAFLVALWFNPISDPATQWVLLAVYVAVAVNNFRVLKKVKP